MTSKKTIYRSIVIEPYEGTQLGYRTSTGERGKGRKFIGVSFMIDGREKIVDTVRAAKTYIDNYLGPQEQQ